jgi:hypothetical protein
MLFLDGCCNNKKISFSQAHNCLLTEASAFTSSWSNLQCDTTTSDISILSFQGDVDFLTGQDSKPMRKEKTRTPMTLVVNHSKHPTFLLGCSSHAWNWPLLHTSIYCIWEKTIGVLKLESTIFHIQNSILYRPASSDLDRQVLNFVSPEIGKESLGDVLNLGVEIWRTNVQTAVSDVRQTTNFPDLLISNNFADQC